MEFDKLDGFLAATILVQLAITCAMVRVTRDQPTLAMAPVLAVILAALFAGALYARHFW